MSETQNPQQPEGEVNQQPNEPQQAFGSLFQDMNRQQILQYFAMKEEMSIRQITAHTDLIKTTGNLLQSLTTKSFLKS